MSWGRIRLPNYRRNLQKIVDFFSSVWWQDHEQRKMFVGNVEQSSSTRFDQLVFNLYSSTSSCSGPIPSAGGQRRILQALQETVNPTRQSTNRSKFVMEFDPYSADFHPLPRQAAYVGWFLVLQSVVPGAMVSALYGMTYDIETSKEW